MKKTFLLLITILLTLPYLGFGQNYEFSNTGKTQGFELISQKSTGVKLQYSVKSISLSDIEIKGEQMQNIQLAHVFLPNNEGMPNLPGESKLIAIPEGAVPVLKVLNFDTETIKNVNLAPAPKIPLDTEPDLEYKKNSKVYSTNAQYPKQPVSISKIRQIRGVDAVMLGVTPFQYNPVSKELTVYKNIEIELTFEGGKGYFGDNRLRNRAWEPILDDALLNYSSLPKIDYNKKNKNTKDGEAEYVILTLNNSDFTDWAETIAEYRRKQGISTSVFTISDIPGGNDVASIEAWVDDMYNNWTTPPAAVLILADYGTGDAGITSQEYPHPYEEDYITDNKYADVDGDDIPDIAFARITANDASQLETMITKFINYESSPPTSADFYNHPISALGWQTERWFQICSEAIGGFWKNGLGKNPVAINKIYDGTPGTTWSTATNTSAVVDYFGPSGLGYIPAQPNELGGNEYWDSGSATAVTNAINNGSFILQHRDHGGETGWGEPSYSNSNIDDLTNTDLSFIMSINCLTGRFDYESEVFAEKFHRHTNGGQNSGALGIIAASQVSYSFVNDTYVWGAYDNMWPEFMPDNTANPESRFIYPAFANVAGKNFLYQSSWPYNTSDKQITYRLFHHHGDPYLNVYSEVPENLTVNCPSTQTFGNLTIDIAADNGATIAVTYFDTNDSETKILGTALSTGGTTSINLASCPTPGTNMLVTITKQNYFRYTQDVMVIAPSGPYDVVQNVLINDGGNHQAEYGESFDFDITVENVGVETSSNVQVSLTTTDPNVVSLTNATNVSFGSIATDGTATSTGQFSTEIANDVTDQHNIQFTVTISDDYTKSVYESTFSITVNAPALTIGGISIDDTGSGNSDGILDAGETADLLIETSNEGHADVTNVIGTIASSSPYLTLNSDITTPSSLNIGQTGNFIFNVTADAGTDTGTPADIDYSVTAGVEDQYTAAETKEIVIGEIPVFNISEGGNVSTCVGLFYDSGGETGEYQNNENYTMTIYPATSGNMIEAVFTMFDVESQSSCNYDALHIYDGTNTSATEIDVYCGTTSPGTITATNDDGALTFMFTSDGSVTKAGWEAEISCYSVDSPSGELTGGNPIICNESSTGTLTLTNNTATVTSWEKRLDGGNWITIANTSNTFSEIVTQAGIWEYRVNLDNGTYYSNIVEITVDELPAAGTATTSNDVICSEADFDLSLDSYTGSLIWQISEDETEWIDIEDGETSPYTISGLNSNAYFRAKVYNGTCNDVFSNSVFVTVNENADGGYATVDNNNICAGSSVLFSLLSYTGAIQWQSSVDEIDWNNISGANTSSFETEALTETTSFRALVTTEYCGDDHSNIIMIDVYNAPISDFTIDSSNEPEILFINNSQNADSYSWDFGDDSGSSTDESPLYTYTENGNFTVVLTASSLWCEDNISVQEVSISTVGLTDLSELGITIHPNPTQGLLYINFDADTQEQEFTLIDISGRELMNRNSSSSFSINLSSYAAGVYFLKIDSGAQTVTKQIIVK
ncbi:MAG: C25 family cysteine peptidase [Bacteroidota bacterium]|nr:C25 family cysteine peptidase [Bacteroidota bacterium]